MSHTKETAIDTIQRVPSTMSVKENKLPLETNVLGQYSEEEAMQMGRQYAQKHGLDPELFARAAVVARSPKSYASMTFLSEDEQNALHQEATRRWYIPAKLIQVIATGSMAAMVQGMDESVINGANLFWPAGLGIGAPTSKNSWLEGVVNSAPYLCCAGMSCWISVPMNKKLGRKWTIFVCCIISAVTCIWSGFANTWWHLLIARFMLGFGIGPKAATVGVYSSECSPTKVRGSLTMLWQFFTAVGIMLGSATSLMFFQLGDHGIGHGGLAWRLMIASAFLPAAIVCLQIPFCPESPRWLMGENRHKEAFDSLSKLRMHDILAARDCFYQSVLLEEESSYDMPLFQKLKELFTVRRNRNALIASNILGFLQQFCGINVIAYYSASIFIESGFDTTSALLASWGYGLLSIPVTIPAFYTIDTFGRRNLLLLSFPLMFVFLMLTACGFWIPAETHQEARLGVITLGIYLFTVAYAIGEGPVPSAYMPESFPLYVRDLGVSISLIQLFVFSCVLSFTWPSMLIALKPQGAIGFYAAWSLVGFFLVLWFLPETKGLTLEELDEVFSVHMMDHARYQNNRFWNSVQRNLLRMDVPEIPPLHIVHRMAITNPEYSEKPEVSHIEA